MESLFSPLHRSDSPLNSTVLSSLGWNLQFPGANNERSERGRICFQWPFPPGYQVASLKCTGLEKQHPHKQINCLRSVHICIYTARCVSSCLSSRWVSSTNQSRLSTRTHPWSRLHLPIKHCVWVLWWLQVDWPGYPHLHQEQKMELLLSHLRRYNKRYNTEVKLHLIVLIFDSRSELISFKLLFYPTDISCPAPFPPSNGDMRLSTNDNVEFFCDDGYVLNGDAVAECQEDGSWSSRTPRCEGERGTVLLWLIQNKINSWHILPNTHSSFLERNTTNARDLQVCGFEKKRDFPVSTAVECSPVGSVPNGYSNGGIYSYPQSVNFGCFPGFQLQGLDEITCQQNGQWSGPLPTCIGKKLWLCRGSMGTKSIPVLATDRTLDDSTPVFADTMCSVCLQGFKTSSTTEVTLSSVS